MYDLPEPTPTAPAAGQAHRDTAIEDAAEKMLTALNAAIQQEKQQPTAVRVEDPNIPSYTDGPRIGDTPPVQQPGIPAMGQQATDIGRAAMYCGLATVPPGLIAIGIMLASEHTDPTVIGMICAAPVAMAVPVFAIGRLVRRAKEAIEAAPPEHHHHYNGPVRQHNDQREIHSRTGGLWVKSNNQQ